MFAKTYSCADFLYAKMKAPELQAREGLVSSECRSLATPCYINKLVVLKADLEEFANAFI